MLCVLVYHLMILIFEKRKILYFCRSIVIARNFFSKIKTIMNILYKLGFEIK